ncbi:MAG: O-antigen ligase family protein [Ginsengibacter sp.]
MKKLFFIDDTPGNKISYYLLAFFLIALPFQHFFSEILLTCFAVHTLIQLKRSKLTALKNKTVWIIASIFFLNLITIIYSNYPSEGFKDVDHQLGILLFPICLAVTNIDFSKYKLSLLKMFAFTCTATIVYLYFEAFRVIHYFHLPFFSIVSKHFINQNFSAPIGLHATYLSMYVTLSISTFFYLFFLHRGNKNWKYIFLAIILFAGLIQLSSRAVFICLPVIIIFAIPAMLLKGKKRLQFSVGAFIAFLLIILAITNIDSLRERYINELENDLTENGVTPDLSKTRAARWNLELRLISKSPFIGYGSGSEKYILKDKYFENKFYVSYLLELNSHNQYLGFLINAGVFGLLLYLYILYFGFATAIKNRDFLFVSLLILITIVSISENILNVNKGIFFYSFFFSFFLLIPPKGKSSSSV